MEPKENDSEWVLNPKTNRFIKKGTALHIRLIKEGVVGKTESYKKPALVVEKKVKAVANVEDLSKTELDDIFSQLKLLREKRDNIMERRGRPIGVKGDPTRPKVKEELKKSGAPKSRFNVSVKAPPKVSDTEYVLSDED